MWHAMLPAGHIRSHTISMSIMQTIDTISSLTEHPCAVKDTMSRRCACGSCLPVVWDGVQASVGWAMHEVKLHSASTKSCRSESKSS